MTRAKTISAALTIFVLLAAFSSCSKKTEKTQELVDFNLGHMNSTAHLLGFVAAEEGFFKEEGLNVTLSQFAGGTDMVSGLESGKLDAALTSSVGIITRQATGHDITIFGGAMTNGHGIVIKTKYVPADFKQGDISVLKGRNIANAINSPENYELQVLLKQNGIEIGEGPDKVNIVYFATPKDAYNAFAGDQIDGVGVYSPFTSIAKNAGHTVVYYCSNVTNFENQPCCRQIALTGTLAAKPQDFIAFERAIIKAYKFTQENHEKTIEDVAKYITIDKKDIEYEVYGGHALSHPDPDKKGTIALKNGIIEFGYTDGVDYDIEKLYNLDIYREALSQILAKDPNDSVYKSMQAYFNTAN
jgi:NitT/TauT family transport system substrate-binding protein